jgi:hypothetical protein
MKKPLLLLLPLLLAACATHTVPPYSVLTTNSAGIRATKAPMIAVGRFETFSGVDLSPDCGSGTLVTASGESLPEYLRRALIEELVVADKFDARSPILLTATITEMHAAPAEGQWHIGVVLRSPNGKSISVLDEFSYQPQGADTVCVQSANAFPMAVQRVLGKLLNHEEFPELLTL